MSAEDSCSEDELYYGSIPVFLASVPGIAAGYAHGDWAVDCTEEALATTLGRSEPISIVQGDGSGRAVVVPCIPARELVYVGEDESDVVPSWPLPLRRPLLKMPASALDDAVRDDGEDGYMKAVASGHRSALVKVKTAQGQQCWFRLKGCGNDSDGFVVQDVPSVAPAAASSTTGESSPTMPSQIRGCAFPQTAVRELHMTTRIRKIMSNRGKYHPMSCNIPLGLYRYDEPNAPFGTDQEEVRPTCALMRTYGDRRLGSHVLAGIEILLPFFLDEAALEGNGSQNLCSMFPRGRPGGCGKVEDIRSTSELAYFYMIQTLHREVMNDFVDDPGNSLKDMDLNSNFLAFVGPKGGDNREQSSFHEKAPDSQSFPVQWTKDGPVPMRKQWQPLWTKTCIELGVALYRLQNCTEEGDSAKSVLGYLFSLLGYDCGRFLGLLHRNRISWGTYQDGLCRKDLDEWHCNAHSNNMVLLPESEGLANRAFLSYLDFDMAFDEQSVVETCPSKRSVTNPVIGDGRARDHKVEHDNLLLREKVNFMEVLAGGDSSNGVPQVARSVVEGYSHNLHAAKAALYDTLVLGFLHGYNEMTGDQSPATLSGKFPVHRFNPDFHQAAYAVVKLGVIVMADYVA